MSGATKICTFAETKRIDKKYFKLWKTYS